MHINALCNWDQVYTGKKTCSLYPNFFNIIQNDLCTNESDHCTWVLVLTIPITSGTSQEIMGSIFMIIFVLNIFTTICVLFFKIRAFVRKSYMVINSQ